jgi:undecaprenyl-diphosphatase
MTTDLHTLVGLVGDHPVLALVTAFLVSAGEAVLFLGIFVPSTAVLLAIGGIIGLGKLPFWPLFIATAVGAMAGDQLSYWIGHVYKERARDFSASERYQRLFTAGERYFQRHGGKSVVIGRFVPAVKSVVPAIAGLSGMPLVRFTVLNGVSSCVWAAAHLLPGLSAAWTLDRYGLSQGWLHKAIEVGAVALGAAAAVALFVSLWRRYRTAQQSGS